VRADQAEDRWRAYACPLVWNQAGKRVFVVDQNGDVCATDNVATRYEGRESRPDAEAALSGVTLQEPMAALNALGRDGSLWLVVT
jgi:hypothetical protein